jgi:hypothetical protein
MQHCSLTNVLAAAVSYLRVLSDLECVREQLCNDNAVLNDCFSLHVWERSNQFFPPTPKSLAVDLFCCRGEVVVEGIVSAAV